MDVVCICSYRFNGHRGWGGGGCPLVKKVLVSERMTSGLTQEHGWFSVTQVMLYCLMDITCKWAYLVSWRHPQSPQFFNSTKKRSSSYVESLTLLNALDLRTHMLKTGSFCAFQGHEQPEVKPVWELCENVLVCKPCSSSCRGHSHWRRGGTTQSVSHIQCSPKKLQEHRGSWGWTTHLPLFREHLRLFGWEVESKAPQGAHNLTEVLMPGPPHLQLEMKRDERKLFFPFFFLNCGFMTSLLLVLLWS